MNRLTKWDEYGNADIIALSDMMPKIYAGLSFSETNALTDALNRLAAYEDTGLNPVEIIGLCSMHERAKMAELLRMEENRPLTLEELREMDGEPVWVRCAKIGYKVAEFYAIIHGDIVSNGRMTGDPDRTILSLLVSMARMG